MSADKAGTSTSKRRDRSGRIAITTERNWCVLRRTCEPAPADLLGGHLGMPALWKPLGSTNGDGGVWTFDVPAGALDAAAETLVLSHDERDGDADGGARADAGGGAPRDGLSLALAWASATADGEPPPDWSAPSRDVVASWLALESLAVQCGPVLRQGSLVHEPRRLALRIPIAPAIPGDLPDARRRWLCETLLDAQSRWRMVRVGISGEGAARAALAEVDLSGAPHALLEHLMPVAADALRCVVEWLAAPVDLLLDTSVPCEIFDLHPILHPMRD